MTLPLPSLAPDNSNLRQILDLIALAIPSGGVASAPRIVSGGATDIATSESTTSTSYTTLTTPDLVTVALPTKGLLAVWYQALWQNTVASNARVAIFLNANQVKTAPGAGGAPIVAEASGPAATNADAYLTTTPTINAGFASSLGLAGSTEVTTGQMVGEGSSGGGVVHLFAAAGTYDVAIKFKNNAAGTLTASKRHLWVAAYSFA